MRVRYPVFQMLAFGSPDVGIAKTRWVWVWGRYRARAMWPV